MRRGESLSPYNRWCIQSRNKNIQAQPLINNQNTMLELSGYRIVEEIYNGVNTVVYRGYCHTSGQTIIVKILKADYPTIEEIARLKQEYQIVQKFDSAGIVKAYSLENYQNGLALILEDFGGISLRQYLTSQKLSLSEFLRIAIDLTEALAYLHKSSIIHKDIKSANIIINPSTGTVKIADFSMASLQGVENQNLGTVLELVGTLAYMSPEQTGRMNRSVDYRTDFYSLGVTFYEMLAGSLPFTTQDTMDLVHCHLAKQPVPLHEQNPEIPEAISSIAMKLLAKTAEERYQSAAGLKFDLEICLQQLQSAGKIDPFPLGRRDRGNQLLIPQKLYGREIEVSLLLEAFDRVCGTSPAAPLLAGERLGGLGFSGSEIILVSGYSGIGKTAIVNEVQKPITRQRGYFIPGKFDQFKRNIPYAALIAAFQELINQTLTENATQIAGWKEKILDAIGFNGQVIIDVIPEVALIIGSQLEVPQVGPTESENRFNRVFLQFVKVFCQPEHPLVLFLDDLQWADSASLKLIQLLITDTDSQYLLLIGAYRDNEVSPAHPLMQTLEKIKEKEATVNNITVKPLDFSHVSQLVADTLNESPEASRIESLSELLFNKTQGNPFFLTQLLKTLYSENLLNYEIIADKWQWDIEQIQAIGITDYNVVELMARNIQKLSDSAQKLLKMAACIGNSFNLDVLAIVNEESVLVTASQLWPAIHAGLLLPLSEAYKIPLVFADSESAFIGLQDVKVNYKFLHDRVQQAAYTLIPESAQKATHLKIGQLLLKNTTPEERKENIFALVNQLNFGTNLLATQPEKDELAQLNFIAGQKAKAATAYEAALRYLTLGIELLAIDSWQTNYDLTLTLHEEGAEAAYLGGDFDLMQKLSDTVRQQAKTLLDKVKVYEVQISACMAQVKILEAINTGLEILKLLDVNFPSQPSESDIQLGMKDISSNLTEKRIADLINLPEMVEPEKLAAMRILLRVTTASYNAAPGLLPLVIFKQINLSLEYGNTSESAFAYAFYGILLCGITEDFNAAYQFGQLALNILAKFNAKKLKAGTYTIVHLFITPWKEHIRETLEPFLEAYRCGLETGELEFTAGPLLDYCIHSYLAGKYLTELEKELSTYSQVMLQIKQEKVLHLNQIYHQTVLNLSGELKNPHYLIGQVYNEETMLPLHEQSNDFTALFFLHFNKLILCFLLEENDRALRNAEIAEKYTSGVAGSPIIAYFYLYYSLVRLSIYPSVPNSEQEKLLEKVTSNQEKMKKWAHHAPMNFQHKYDLVEAEKARVLGDLAGAINYYDRAISGAREQKYIQEEALANELAGKFHLSRGQENMGRFYLLEAYYCYGRWGAKAKVKNLESKYPGIFSRITERKNADIDVSNTTLRTSGGSGGRLDFTTAIEASQALSSVIVLDELLSRLMKISIENAGAQKGFLILDRSGSLEIEVSGQIEDGNITVSLSPQIEFSQALPIAVINYVERTRKNVVLNDAFAEAIFKQDAYIAANKTRSILCTAIINQGRMMGLLYLENNLVTGAFTPARLQILQLISAQAAISLENALLYRTLEEKVEDRTAQISQTNQLLQQEIIDRKQIEVQLRQSKARYIAIIEDQTELIIRFLPDGQVTFVNEAFCRFFGLRREEIIGYHYAPVVFEEDREYVAAFVNSITKQNPVVMVENRVIARGEVRWTQWIDRGIFDESDRIAEYQVVGRDITDRKKAEAELETAKEAAESANRAKSTFLANMSHELRTPLNAILGFSQLMSRATNLAKEQQDNLGIIRRSGEHLLTLINQVLDLSKIEAGRMTLHENNFDLYLLLNDVENMFSLKAKEKGLQLKCDRAVDVPQHICTDEVKLRQVLINLIGNSIKFTSQGSVSLTVKLGRKNSQSITFQVIDTGVGIAADELQNLFKPFVQTTAGQQVQEGTGLGLTISRQFIRLMGGEITVISHGIAFTPGTASLEQQEDTTTGTIFQFDIQANQVAASEIEQRSDRRRVKALAPNQPEYRMLIVDDSNVNRQLLHKLLNPLGFKLQEANNGTEALSLWEHWQPHLIWMDMRMSVMDGDEATRQIRSREQNRAGTNSLFPIPHTVIIALSASAFTDEKVAVLAAGCDDFIRKPFREEEIFDVIHKHLGVSFIYEESTSVPDAALMEPLTLKPSHLAALPKDMLGNLRQALVEGDLEAIAISVEQIRQQEKVLGAALLTMIDQYEFEQLLTLIHTVDNL